MYKKFNDYQRLVSTEKCKKQGADFQMTPHYFVYETQKKGMRSLQVTQIQRSLPIWTSQEVLVADGIFGTKTEIAVKEFQDGMGLSKDGVVGHTTAQALGIWTEVERGFDISHWNTVYWDKVPDAISFVNIKSTEGISYIDTDFTTSYQSAKDIGLDVGAYHFTKFQSPPIMEAANFLSQVVGLDISKVYLDLEFRSSGLSALEIEIWATQFMQTLTAFFPTNSLGIYTSRNVLYELGLQKATSLTKYQLWAADWAKQPLVAPWTTWDTWQYTSTESPEWVNGTVDLNLRVF